MDVVKFVISAPGTRLFVSGPRGAPSNAVTFGDQKVLELPGVGGVGLWLVVALEEVGIVLEGSPVRSHRLEFAQVGLAEVQHILVGQVVGYA